MSKKLISIVIPCFNEEDSINKLYQALIDVLDKLNSYNIEVIMVNDGSTDNTLFLMKEIYKKDKRFKVISFSRNFGQQMAFTAGIDYANGDAVILMDADLQDPPAVILDMIRKWEQGYEVIYGLRKTRMDDSFFKRFTANLFYKFLSNISYVNIPQNVGDFRLIDRKVVLVLRQFKERNRFLRGLISYIGFNQTFVEFDRPAGTRLESHYTFKKMLDLANNAIIGFSNFWVSLIFLLSIVSVILGFCLFVVSLLTLFYSSLFYLTIVLTIIYLIFIFTSFALFLSIAALYLLKIYDEVRQRPLYIISEFLE